MNTYNERLQSVRAMMREKGWDAIVITASDPHNSEYPGARWKQVLWLTGFAGECGDVVITQDHAGLWTDTRYFIQANKVLPGTGYELHKTRVPEQVLIPEWLACHAFGDKANVVIAVDGLTQPISYVDSIKGALSAAGRQEGADENVYRIINSPDLLDSLWGDRPAVPCSPIITLGTGLTGESRQDKILWLRGFMLDNKCDAILLTALDEIAWVLNARGSDVEYNPVIISYLLVTMDKVNWYVRKNTLSRPDEETAASFAEMQAEGISILPYDDIDIALASLAGDEGVTRLYADPSTLNYNLHNVLETNCPAGFVKYGTSPVPLRKSIKTSTEIAGFIEAHNEDGLALEKFYYWLENEMAAGHRVDEWSAAVKLQSFRKEIPGYRGDSFETISAYGPGAALPHYVTPSENAPVLEPHGLYLVDSGGQYLYGTTDTTRTVPLGPCTDLEKEDYTLVLKCFIDLNLAVFPKGTCGCHLDILARNPLWQYRRNFGHGTGHGVGFFLNVHEGPQEFRQNFNSYPYVPGIVNTIEPGIYREGMHGVRHENVFIVVEDSVNGFGTWYKFKSITRCHIDTSVVVREMLSQQEIDWLNDYNRSVYETHAPKLSPEMAEWLRGKTAAI